MSPVGRVEAAILRALAMKGAKPGGRASLSGSEIANAVEEVSGGQVRVSLGGLYNMLNRLSDRGNKMSAAKGLITVTGRGSGRRGKLYQLTADGVAELSRLDSAPSQVNWGEGTTGIAGKYAEYAIDSECEFEGRGQIFNGHITKVYVESELPDWARVGAPVMLKCMRTTLPPGKSDAAAIRALAGFIDVVNDAIATEFEALRSLNELDCVPDTIDSGFRKVVLGDGAIRKARFIVQEKIDGVPLWKYLNEHYGKNEEFRGMPLDDWFGLAEKLVSGLNAIHNGGTVHRDIFPTNIVIRHADGWPVFGDVGDAVFRRAAFIQLPNEDRSRPYTAPEHRGRPLVPSRRADIYAICGVLFRMATGHAPNVDGPVHDEAIKRAVAAELADTPNRLLYQCFGIADIISRGLRASPVSRIGSANALLQDIRVFRHHRTSRPKLASLVEGLRQRVTELDARPNSEVFRALAALEIGELEDRIKGMINGDVIIEGGHERIVLKMCSYLATLGDGVYWAVTVPQFFDAKNLGVRGRFMSMNLELAKRGITIKRLFLLSDSDRHRPETHEILRAQLEAEQLFHDSANAESGGSIETRFRIYKHAKDIAGAINKGDQKGVWISGPSAVELRPVYDSFGVTRVVNIKRTEKKAAEVWFEKYWTNSRVLDENWALSGAVED